MNQTIEKFGWPDTLVQDFDHWVILVRPTQPTLGSLVVAAKSQATAFGDLPAEAHAELKRVTATLEAALKATVDYEKINYLMLMMVDPHVHFHVIPRYAGVRDWNGATFPDHGWPKAPDLSQTLELDPSAIRALVLTLRDAMGPTDRAPQ